ncbi:30S ribosomal protein S9 [Candidatus Alkanophaga liquidiphilum]|nr:MAG: 30S ribosomal protein S9 [Candidatus Alkanophagales archaeon]
MPQRIVNAVGKKKTAVARATIKEGRGVIRINKMALDAIQPEVVKEKILEPIMIASEILDGDMPKIDIEVRVEGGGFMGRAEAIRTAIARGLVEWTGSETLREAFLRYDRNLLISDPRRKEPKKYGGRGARARRQKSYR